MPNDGLQRPHLAVEAYGGLTFLTALDRPFLLVARTAVTFFLVAFLFSSSSRRLPFLKRIRFVSRPCCCCCLCPAGGVLSALLPSSSICFIVSATTLSFPKILSARIRALI